MVGRIRPISARRASRHWRDVAVVVAAASSVAISGTMNVSGSACASAGTAMIDEPKPVAPKTVYAAKTTIGSSTRTCHGTAGNQSASTLARGRTNGRAL